jgi:hypothetical protein
VPRHSAVSAHKPRTRDLSWALDGLQSDMDTDRVMVNLETGILIKESPKLNDFQIKMSSVFNTISEWFMVNSLSLNLNMVQKFLECTSIYFVL